MKLRLADLKRVLRRSVEPTTHYGHSAVVEITYVLRITLNNALYACMVASDPKATPGKCKEFLICPVINL